MNNINSLINTYPFDDHEITRNLSRSQREKFCAENISQADADKVARLLNSESGIEEITDDLKHYEFYPRAAIRAFFEKKITEEQLATVCIFYSAIDQMIYNIQRFEARIDNETQELTITHLNLGVPLSDHYNHSSLVSKLRCHKVVFPSTDLEFLHQFFQITAGLDLVASQLESKPLSERYFLTFSLPIGPPIYWSPLYQRLCQISNLYHPVSDPLLGSTNNQYPLEQKYLVVPSFTLFRLCIFHSNFTMKPYLGSISTRQINSLRKKFIRPINIAAPDAKLPTVADGWPCGGQLVFTIHDFYHALRFLITPQRFHLAVGKIVKLIKQMIENSSNSDERKALKTHRWKLIDGEIFSAPHPCFNEVFLKMKWPANSKELVLKHLAENTSDWIKECELTQEDIHSVFEKANPEGDVCGKIAVTQ